ncbi:CinA family protein [Arthrobacter sp. Sa2CUA1]|uniref:CinA family protein n=2 Tax=Arthrobacter TaxID=1663 RepID=A0ABR8UQE1_9MICC|nr:MULTISPECIES: nicotinamide-nucleotide amidohydrolase family protein [Arthrobacter]MBD7994780.1 CinA family protein [Arthrobacter gallicola]MBD8042493.1 CinA family protein [Arthrobacter pullicola]
MNATNGQLEELPHRIAEEVERAGLKVALAESLTCGNLTGALGKGGNTGQWLCGGIVAYLTEVKQSVLGVSPGPVVSARCAEEMAAGAARLFGADVAVSTTGAGGPGPLEGQPAGTVFIGWSCKGATGSSKHQFDGAPEEVIEQTEAAALQRLLELARQA